MMTVAATMMFWRLGDSALGGDEATYAMIAGTMHDTGNWLDVVYLPGHPAYQKPPLYMWLTNVIRPVLGDSEITYRAGSASFGVATVGLTVAMAAMLFTPEIGLLAGLVLLTNSTYLLNHGARAGTFDTGLSFCLMLAWLLIWRARQGRQFLICCIAAGILFGIACLLKPLAGLPMLALLSCVLLLQGSPVGIRRRLRGIAIAAIFMLITAGWWYVAQVIRHGREFINVIFWQNLVARSFTGLDPRALNGRWFYWAAISKSSTMSALFLPAMVICLVCAIRSRRRIEFASLLILCLGWVLIFSVSVSKLIHYAYPVFPVIAIAIAVVLGLAIDAGARALKPSAVQPWIKPSMVALLAIGLLGACVQFLTIRVERAVTHYRPWEAFKVLLPAVATHRARIALVGFPGDPGDWQLQADIGGGEHFYLRQMQPALRINTAEALAHLLAEHQPTLLLFCRSNPLYGTLDRPENRSWMDERFSWEQPSFAMRGLDMLPLFHCSVHDDSPVLRRVSSSTGGSPAPQAPRADATRFDRTFTILIDTPIVADSWVTATVKFDASPGATRLLYTATIDGEPSSYADMPTSDSEKRLSVYLQPRTEASIDHPLNITFKVVPINGPEQAIRGSISDVTFDAYPTMWSK